MKVAPSYRAHGTVASGADAHYTGIRHTNDLDPVLRRIRSPNLHTQAQKVETPTTQEYGSDALDKRRHAQTTTVAMGHTPTKTIHQRMGDSRTSRHRHGTPSAGRHQHSPVPPRLGCTTTWHRQPSDSIHQRSYRRLRWTPPGNQQSRPWRRGNANHGCQTRDCKLHTGGRYRHTSSHHVAGFLLHPRNHGPPSKSSTHEPATP